MKFSVSLCVYLGNTIQEYIRCLRSILSNTILPNEIVVFVDGPLSFSIEQAHKLIPDTIEIKVVKSDINVGHGLARKNSVENCRNELISIVDVDDFCVKDRFERQINIFINRPEIDIVGGAILEINSKGEVFEKILPIAHKDIVDLMKWRCPLNQMTVMFRKSVYDDAGGYVHFYHNEDYYLWYRLMINGANFCNLKEVLMHCHIDDSYFSRRRGWNYFRSEMELKSSFLQQGVISKFEYIIQYSARVIVQVILPRIVIKRIYKYFLRK